MYVGLLLENVKSKNLLSDVTILNSNSELFSKTKVFTLTFNEEYRCKEEANQIKK